MWWGLFAFLALAAGVLLFGEIQESIPDELAFLKGKPGAAVLPKVDTRRPGSPGGLGFDNGRATAWLVRKGTGYVEVGREFSTPIQAGSARYDAPELVFTCYRDRLYARIEPRLRLDGTRQQGDFSQVAVNGQAAEKWTQGPGLAVFAPNAHSIVQAALKAPKLTMTLAFAEVPRQTFTLDTGGLQAALREMPANCLG